MSTLQEKVAALPLCPGCYIFKNADGIIIYIGKSKTLRNRVRQYFQNVDAKEGKYKSLAREIRDVEFITTATERDALLLECQLIKEHLPRYNSQLKRKRHFPFIRIDVRRSYPTISISESMASDGALYFGCFYSEEDAERAITLMNHIWQTPLCMKEKFPKRPCLNYHIQKCCAPCCGVVSETDYAKKIKEIRACLSGKPVRAQVRLQTKMQQAALAMDYEQAGLCRDLIDDLTLLKRRSRRLNTAVDRGEWFLFFRAFREEEYSIFYIKDGVVLYRQDFSKVDQLESDTLAGMLQKILAKDYTVHDTNLTSYLLDVYADKYYTRISTRCRMETLVKRLSETFYEFTESYDEN